MEQSHHSVIQKYYPGELTWKDRRKLLKTSLFPVKIQTNDLPNTIFEISLESSCLVEFVVMMISTSLL